MRENLLAWQWAGYTTTHTDRRNLAIHLATAPIFHAGTLLLIGGLFTSPIISLLGAGMMATTMFAQMRGHKIEKTAPSPFLDKVDLLSRFFAEQWVTFPRFVISGGWQRAWKAAGGAR